MINFSLYDVAVAVLICAFVPLWLTSADEVDNLDPIVVMENSTAPLAATHDRTIEFDRDSRSGKIKLGD